MSSDDERVSVLARCSVFELPVILLALSVGHDLTAEVAGLVTYINESMLYRWTHRRTHSSGRTVRYDYACSQDADLPDNRRPRDDPTRLVHIIDRYDCHSKLSITIDADAKTAVFDFHHEKHERY
ncbi:hypothetical protein KEM52_002583 [Ascosphaera acerosa]|nr:hypothetical protein KEM52_002583 [Ascosphaera acerosa]